MKLIWKANTIALLGVAIFFRCWMLGSIPGMNGDEAWLGVKALRVAHGEATQWKTNTGNLPNLFYFLPLIALHGTLPPSFVLLRVVAATSGVLALGLNYVLCRRAFDQNTAIVSTLLLAVLPVNIIYSRFGWEPSQILAASLLVIYFSVRIVNGGARSPFYAAGGVLAFGAAFVVHPTTIFLAPFVLLAICYRWPAWIRKHLDLRRAATNGVLLRSAAVWAAIFGAAILIVYLKRDLFAERLRSLHPVSDIFPFTRGATQLFSGTSSYRFIPGSNDLTLLGSPVFKVNLWDMAATVAGVLILILLARILRAPKENYRSERMLLGSLAVSLAAFFVLAGSPALSPESLRYGLWMVAPGVLLASRAAALLPEYSPRHVHALALTGMVVLWGSLIGFYFQYFDYFFRTGGTADTTFRTAREEPKQSAAHYLLEHRAPGQTNYILTSDWWIHWPVKYVAGEIHDMTFLFGDAINDPRRAASLNAAMQGGALWFIEFAGTSNARNLRAGLKKGRVAFDEKIITDYGGKPILDIVHPRPLAFRKKAP